MIDLDQSQRAFRDSKARNIRLLAPAGCGKTAALLHRCLAIASRSEQGERFLLMAFTRAARDEMKMRLERDETFAPLRGRAEPWTLNSFAWDRRQSKNAKFLDREGRRDAVEHALRPLWEKDEHLAAAVGNWRRRGAEKVMDAIDAFASLGFDHLGDSDLERFYARYLALCEQGLEPQLEQQMEMLAELEVIDPDRLERATDRFGRAKLIHRRFFRFWCRAMRTLGQQALYTHNGQKYWFWIDYRSPDHKGVARSPIRGAPRFHHVIVDEFQDVDPLDIAMINAISERHDASLVITGDDDQAIYEFRGASPEYILEPELYLGRHFRTMTLSVNYRSPANIVEHSQRLIRNNKRRRRKKIAAATGNRNAELKCIEVGSASECSALISEIADEAGETGTIGVIARTRGELIPYLVYFATEGGPVYTVEELDAFGGAAFKQLEDLLQIWGDRNRRVRKRNAIADAIEVLNLIKRYKLNSADRSNIERYLNMADIDTCAGALREVASYQGPRLKKGDAADLSAIAMRFIGAPDVGAALRATEESPGLQGLRFDWEKSAEDVWYADPPLVQLADMADVEGLSVDLLLGRMATARSSVVHLPSTMSDIPLGVERLSDSRPLHLMTAHRAKGKEFDTVVLLNADDRTWPPQRQKEQTERELEAERRLFYVAFTRARRRIILLKYRSGHESQFVTELRLPKGWATPDG